jgi:CRISPR/Cas system-associated endonuclease Cas1
VGVSAGARSWALANDVGVVFVSRRGSYLGQTIAADSASRVVRLRAQIRASADDSRRMRRGSNSLRSDRATMFYPIIVSTETETACDEDWTRILNVLV